MIDPVTRTAGARPPAERVAPAAATTAPAPAPASAPASAKREAADTDRAGAPASAKPEPLSLDVTRSDGVFVYTLRDPATDTVVAVIPREAVRPGRTGGKVDQRV